MKASTFTVQLLQLRRSNDAAEQERRYQELLEAAKESPVDVRRFAKTRLRNNPDTPQPFLERLINDLQENVSAEQITAEEVRSIVTQIENVAAISDARARAEESHSLVQRVADRPAETTLAVRIYRATHNSPDYPTEQLLQQLEAQSGHVTLSDSQRTLLQNLLTDKTEDKAVSLTSEQFAQHLQSIQSSDDPAYQHLLSDLQRLDTGDAFGLVRQYRRSHPDSDADLLKQLMKDVVAGETASSDTAPADRMPPALDTSQPLDQTRFSEQIRLIDEIGNRKKKEEAYQQFLDAAQQMIDADTASDFARYHMQNDPTNQSLVKQFIADFDADAREVAVLKGRVKNIVKNARHQALRKPTKYIPAERIEADRMEVINQAKDYPVAAAMAAKVYRTLYHESIDPGLEEAMSNIELGEDEEALMQKILTEFGIVQRDDISLTPAEFSVKIEAIRSSDNPDERNAAYQLLLSAARSVPRDDLYQMAKEYMQQPDSDKQLVKQLIQELDSEDAATAHLRQQVYRFVQKLHQNSQRTPDQYARHQEIAEDRAKIISDALRDPVIGAMVARVYRDTYRSGKLYSKRLQQAIEDTSLTPEQEAVVQEMINDF